MKNVFRTSLALGGVLALTLTACGAPPEEGEGGGGGGADGETVKACLVSDQAGFNDRSFNQSAKEGLDRAVSELGIESATAESSGPADFEQNINNLLAQNCTVLFGVAFTLNDAIRDAAEANPDTEFVLIDSRITKGDPPEEVDLPNAKALVFNTAEAAYLAGYLAAGVSETGVIGTWGGLPIPPVQVFMDGFVDGAARYSEDNDKDIKVIGWDKDTQSGSFVGGFQDQGKGKQLTEGMISQNADVIMPVAGNAGNGALAAVDAAAGAKIVWVDFDGYETTEFKDIILSSVIKNVGNGVYDTIESVQNDDFSNEAYVGNLENGGVDLAPFHDFDGDVSDELKSELEAIEKDIISGDLVVETSNQP